MQTAIDLLGAELSKASDVKRWAKRVSDYVLAPNPTADHIVTWNTTTGMPVRAADLTADDLTEMQVSIERIVSTLTATRTARAGEEIRPESVGLDGLEFYALETLPDRAMITLAGRPGDLFRLAVLRAMSSGSLSRIQVCPEHRNERCHRFYYKVGRRKYCSANCLARPKMRERRKRDAEANRRSIALAKKERTS